MAHILCLFSVHVLACKKIQKPRITIMKKLLFSKITILYIWCYYAQKLIIANFFYMDLVYAVEPTHVHVHV